jgi:putative glutamine amidotransferase
MQQHATSASFTIRPLIGITSADDPTPDNYVAAIERCGGIPVVLENVLTNVDADLSRLSGLVVSGGSDIDPVRYGASAHALTQPGDPARDDYELAIIRRAFERGIPTLAICRGMQIANVAWGGTLHQHLPDLIDGSIVHDDEKRKFVAFHEHTVTVVEDSLLAQIAQSVLFATNASHHQSIARIGNGLRAVAQTSDGVIEALERTDASSFWLATQWHPERLIEADDGRSRRILDAFITAAAGVAAAQKLPA